MLRRVHDMPSTPSLEKTSPDAAIEHEERHHHRDVEADTQHLGDEEFGGHEARKKLEKKLLRKLDARMSILIVIYILNYVRLLSAVFSCGPVLNLDILDRP